MKMRNFEALFKTEAFNWYYYQIYIKNCTYMQSWASNYLLPCLMPLGLVFVPLYHYLYRCCNLINSKLYLFDSQFWCHFFFECEVNLWQISVCPFLDKVPPKMQGWSPRSFLFGTFRSFLFLKECSVLFRSFFELLATYETQKNVPFFSDLF